MSQSRPSAEHDIYGLDMIFLYLSLNKKKMSSGMVILDLFITMITLSVVLVVLCEALRLDNQFRIPLSFVLIFTITKIYLRHIIPWAEK